jgi:hypothetical protein
VSEKHWIVEQAEKLDLASNYCGNAEDRIANMFIGAIRAAAERVYPKPSVSELKRLIKVHKEAEEVLAQRSSQLSTQRAS